MRTIETIIFVADDQRWKIKSLNLCKQAIIHVEKNSVHISMFYNNVYFCSDIKVWIYYNVTLSTLSIKYDHSMK